MQSEPSDVRAHKTNGSGTSINKHPTTSNQIAFLHCGVFRCSVSVLLCCVSVSVSEIVSVAGGDVFRRDGDGASHVGGKQPHNSAPQGPQGLAHLRLHLLPVLPLLHPPPPPPPLLRSGSTLTQETFEAALARARGRGHVPAKSFGAGLLGNGSRRRVVPLEHFHFLWG